MKKVYGVLLLLTSSLIGVAQSSSFTTFILVRHAEKETGAATMQGGVANKDPELSEQGKGRALRLAEMFQQQKISATYSTNYKRTVNTAKPMAEKNGVEVQLYEPMKDQTVLDMVTKHKGQTILVVGHSNTIPKVANLLLGKAQFADYAEDEYGKILIVSVAESGNASVVELKY